MNNNISFKTPVVSVKVTMGEGCGLEAFVNGIPITSPDFFNGGPSSVYIPISHLLIPGTNRLKVLAWPSGRFNGLSRDETSCKTEVIVWDSSSMEPHSAEAIRLEGAEISMYEGALLDNGSLIEGRQPAAVINKVLQGNLVGDSFDGVDLSSAALDFDDELGWTYTRDYNFGFNSFSPQWMSSVKIENSENVKKSLFSAYSYLWKILNTNDYGAWQKLNNEKYSELATSNHVEVQKLWDESVLLGPILKGEDKNWSLLPLDIDTSIMRVLAGNRLATIVTDNWVPILRFRHLNDDDREINIPVYLRLKNGKWVISR